jgi:hypothetical protein
MILTLLDFTSPDLTAMPSVISYLMRTRKKPREDENEAKNLIKQIIKH